MTVGLAFLGVEHSHSSGKLRAACANPRAALLGVYEPSPEIRQQRASQEAFAGVHWFASQEELLAAKGLQGVLVDGYPRHNVALTKAALEAGKSVLMEKPAGVHPGDLEMLQAIAREQGVYLQIGYQFRYTPAFEFTRRAVSDGLLGDVFFFRGRISKAQSVYELLRPELERYQGGNFYELGCHILDMGVALMGPAQSVQRVLRTDYGQNTPFADNTVAVVEFAKGIGVFETSAMEIDPKRRLEVYGTRGSIIMAPIMPNNVELCLDAAQGPYSAGWQTVDVPERPMFSKDVEEFVDVIQGAKSPDYSFEHDLCTQTALMRICYG
jgi:predicted dehydrogenase